MNEKKQRPSITLAWSLSNFVSGLENTNQFQEILDPEDFLDFECVQSYWSFPERVISMRQMIEWKRNYREESVSGYLEKFTILEKHVHDAVSIIINLINRWAQLNHFIQHPNLMVFREFFHKHWSNLQKYSQITNLDALKRQELSNIVNDFNEFIIWASVGYQIEIPPLDNKIGQYCLVKDDRQHEQMSPTDINEYCRNVLLGIENYYIQFLKNEKIEGPDLGILNLGHDVRLLLKRIEDTYDLKTIDKEFEATTSYTDEVLANIQSIADYICKRISFEMSVVPSDVSIMIDHIKSIVHDLKCSQKKKNEVVSNYLNGGRCVACLILDNKTSIMAFSGFQDIPPVDSSKGARHDSDNQLIKHIRSIMGITKSGYGDIFEKIAEADNSMLATLSARVMRNLVRFEVDKHGQLSKRGPFVDEINNFTNGSKELSDDARGILKSKYSCCERKILAFLSGNTDILKSKEAVLLVKYEPCLSCYGALQAWKMDEGILLETYFLFPYTK